MGKQTSHLLYESKKLFPKNGCPHSGEYGAFCVALKVHFSTPRHFTRNYEFQPQKRNILWYFAGQLSLEIRMSSLQPLAQKTIVLRDERNRQPSEHASNSGCLLTALRLTDILWTSHKTTQREIEFLPSAIEINTGRWTSWNVWNPTIASLQLV